MWRIERGESHSVWKCALCVWLCVCIVSKWMLWMFVWWFCGDADEMAAQPSMFQNAWSARLFNSKTLLWIIIIKAYQTTTAKKTKKTKLRSVAKCMFCVFFSSPTLASQLRWDGNFFTSPLNFYNTHWTLEYVNLHLKYTHNARFFYCFAVRLTCQTHIWKSDFWMRGFEVFLTWFFFFFDVYMDWNQIICNKKM